MEGLNHPDYKQRAKRRRKALAILKGGACRVCGTKVADLNNFGRDSAHPFEFDHIYPLEEYMESPITNILQFRISGSDCARRSWQLVRRHCIVDTELLCRECHYQRTMARVEAQRN